jgi:hypothetical protein
MDGWDFINRSLWGEDGSIFINQSAHLGLSSIWTPYAGYLHVFIRIVAYLANFADLQFIPYIYFLGWLLAYIFTVYIISSRLLNQKISRLTIVITIALVSLQPHLGEVFFTLTNSQWLLGLCLFIYVLIPKVSWNLWIDLPIIGILSLTGPFSIITLPVFCLKIYLANSLSKDWPILVTIAVGALTQLVLLLFFTDRLEKSTFEFSFFLNRSIIL